MGLGAKNYIFFKFEIGKKSQFAEIMKTSRAKLGEEQAGQARRGRGTAVV